MNYDGIKGNLTFARIKSTTQVKSTYYNILFAQRKRFIIWLVDYIYS